MFFRLIKHNSQSFFQHAKQLFFAIVLLLCFNNAGCQRSISPQAQSAIDLFTNKQFVSAKEGFQKLLERFPQDPLYHYYLGASLSELNIQPLEAIDNLKFATLKNVNINAWFYLYREYYRLFKFNEALDALNEFKKRARWQDNYKMGTSGEIEKVNSAIKFFAKAIQPMVIDKFQVQNDSVLSIIAKKTGLKLFKINKVPKINNPITIFIDSTLNVDHYYYFSAKSNSNSNSTEIFRIKLTTDNLWSEPENLGQKINSGLDCDYPFFDEQTSTLYFASKGHNSLGGFDIFKSNYNNNNEWSEPEQLSFPINSQWNDYNLFVTSKFIYFVSDRENTLGFSTIYQISKPLPVVALNIEQSNEAEIAKLKINAPELQQKETSKHEYLNRLTSKTETNSPIFEIVQNALDLQVNTDSLIIAIQNNKRTLNELKDKEQRAILFSENSKNEKLILKQQHQINELYKQITSYENELTANQKIKNEDTLPSIIKFSIGGKSIYSKENPFPHEIEIPKGVIYRIQLGVFSKPLDYYHFGGMKPITIEILQENKLYKYYAGVFQRFIDADNILLKIKELGFKEAFIVAYFDNQKIPLERAKEIEKDN